MASRCTGTNRGITPVSIEDGERYEYVEAGKDYSFEVPQIEGAESYRLNQRVELPAGLKFENGKLSGKVANEGVYHIDFIGDDAEGKAVGAFKLILTVTTGNAAKGGCFGDIASVSAMITLVAVAGVGLLLVSKRRRQRA